MSGNNFNFWMGFNVNTLVGKLSNGLFKFNVAARSMQFMLLSVLSMCAANYAYAAPYSYSNTVDAPINALTTCAAPLIRTFTVPTTEDFTITDLNIGFTADHTYRGDIRVSLLSPALTSVTFIASNNGDADNNYDILVDSASTNPIDDGDADDTTAPLYDRTTTSSSSLSVLNGQRSVGVDINGVAIPGIWTMRICDVFSGSDNGTFRDAELQFQGNPNFDAVLTKDNDANLDSVYSDIEYVAAAGSYPVSFQLTITNSSLVDGLLVSSLVDDIHGDVSLLGGSCAAVVGTTVAAGATQVCTFDTTVTLAGPLSSELDTVTLQGTQGATSVTLTDTSTVAIPGPTPADVFYVPFPADEILTSLQTIYPGAATCGLGSGFSADPITTVISISVLRNNTIIYYDESEDGFEADITQRTQTTTQVWGDQNIDNGARPGVTTDAGDVLTGGTSIVLQNDVISATQDTVIDFDGKDKVASTQAIAMTRVGWADNTETLLAGAWEMNSTARWGLTHILPVGEDLASGQVYEHVGASILSSADGNTITVDLDGNPATTGDITTVALNEGETYFINGGLNLGATIDSTALIQVNLITGDYCSNFASRFIRLGPTNLWTSSYFNPVFSIANADTAGSTAANAKVTLFNPDPVNPITVQVDVPNGAGGVTNSTVIVAAGSTNTYTMPAATAITPTSVESGAHFYTLDDSPFYPVISVDDDSPNAGQIGTSGLSYSAATDWGFALVGEDALSQQIFVGLGLGRDPNSTVNLTENGSPIWVTTDLLNGFSPTGGIEICVDYNNDGVSAPGATLDPTTQLYYDLKLTLNRLDSVRLLDPDGDQTAMFVFVCDPDTDDQANAILSGAWGIDASIGSEGQPGLDLGTGIPNVKSFTTNKLSAFSDDLNGDGLANTGDIITYSIDVTNTGFVPISTLAIVISDLLPTQYVEYILNSTTFDGTPLPDDTVGLTPFIFDEGGFNVPSPIGLGQTVTFAYDVRVIDVPFAPDQICNSAIGANGTETDDSEDCINPGLASVQGTVLQDNDGDGVGDTPLVGAIISLFSDPNGDGNPDDGVVIATTTTAADGSYVFADVTPDDYVVHEADPAGLSSVNDGDASSPDFGADAANASITDSYIPVTVARGEDDIDNDFVDAQTGAITGLVWLDEDRDGINDIEEAGLTGIIVELRDGVCTPLPSGVANCPTASTNQTGYYSFNGLLPGTYDIVVDPTTLPAGVSNTAGQFGVASRGVSLIGAETITDQNFGYVADANTGIIGDRVWNDADGDGIQDPGESGIEGVVLTLSNAAGTPIGTATTNANGDYLFTNVAFGNDYVVSINPADVALSGFTPSPIVNVSGDQSESSYVGHPVSLNASLTTVTDVDFGFNSPAANNTIIDTVWFDENGDGVFDATEAPITGVTVNLYQDINLDGIPDDDDGDGQPDVVATATTNANGDVTFPGLADGSYILGVTDTASELAGLDGTTAEAIASLSDPVAVAGGVTDDQNSFGYNNPGLIAGTIYSDGSNNADQDAGEPGIASVEVTLRQDTNGDSVYDTVVGTVFTNPDGSYSFDGLPPGDYQVEIVNAPTGTQTEDPDAAIDNATEITLGLGESSVENNFGYFNPALYDVQGTVFLDADKDGFEDLGEGGIPAVTLDLVVPALAVIDSALDINGDGVIDGADDGTYLGFAIIDGLVDLNGDASIDGSDDGQLNGIAIVDGRFDFDANGLVDAVNRLTDDGTLPEVVLATTTADANGDYIFQDLPSGTYQVQVTDTVGLLAGYDLTSGLDALPVLITNFSVVDVDFGYINEERTGSIMGEVFLDENANGSAQATENNYSGVDVYLCNSPVASEPCDPTDPEYITSTVTDANGEYAFTGLPAGQYLVDVDQTDLPAGLSNTVNPVAVALSEGATVDNVDVGYVPTAGAGLISGEVWADANNNGVFDNGEAPIGGVTILIYDPNSATPAVPIGSVDTVADGSWSFALNTGAGTLVDDLIVTYDSADVPVNLEETQPSNLQTGVTEYANDDVDVLSDADNFIGDLSFGFAPALGTDLGSISGTIYSDVDQNGDYLAATDGEYEGITINLLDSSGNIIASTVTDQIGAYSFTGLQDDPAGYTVVVTDLGNVLQNVNVLETLLPLIPIVGGADITDVDQGYISQSTVTLGSIGSLVWIDVNGDGFADDGEPRVAGVTVQCWVDNDLSATPNDPGAAVPATDPEAGVDNLVRTVTTDQNGEYYCTNLPQGQYIVSVTDANGVLAGYTDSSVNNTLNNPADNFAKPLTYAVTTNAGITNLAADFGFEAPSSISGTVYFDRNADGDYQTGSDVDLGGVEVQACDANNVCITVFTNPDGTYTIPVGAGSWTVTVLTPPNGTRELEVPAANPVTVNVGDDITEVDFGFVGASTPKVGSITGSVLEDTTGDNLGDTPIIGATIQLYTDPNGDGDPSDGVLAGTTTSDGSGNYQFIGLLANGTNYVVLEIDPADFSSVSDSQSVDVPLDAADNVLTGTNDNLIPVTLYPNEVDANNNFVDLLPGSLAGTVWLDEDLDGINDIEEGGLTGIVVELLNGVCTPLPSPAANCPTTTTDANGNYHFDNVVAGDYIVNVVDTTLPPGLTNTAGIGGVDPKLVSVAPGDTVEDVDFGYISNPGFGVIGDRVWNDNDGDGIQDSGESGIEGVVMTLSDANGVLVTTATTNANGDYLFTNVMFGNDYVVSIGLADPALTGYSPSPLVNVAGDQSESSYVGHPVSLNAQNTTVTDVDFGFANPAAINSISDTVWFDENGDGVFDATEAPISGVTVNLYQDINLDGIPDDDDGDGQPDVVATATTDASGNVNFAGLEDGTYILGVTDNASKLTGLNGTTPEGVTKLSDPVVVAGGVPVDEDSFGYNNPGLIAGTIYSDGDNNADQNAGEAGIASVEVVLLEDTNGDGTFDTIVATVFTNPDGSYEFDGLPPGAYQVQVTPPGGIQLEDPDLVPDGATDITLGIGQSSVSNDFGYNDTYPYDVSGTVFLDTDKDGVQDTGEVGIAGVTLDLVAAAVDVIDGLLDINNDGMIDAADDGTYLGLTIIDGLIDINRDGNVDAADDGQVNGITVIDGQLDVNNSGSIDTLDDGTLPEVVLATTTADANGEYTFLDLPNGNYQVQVTDTDGLLGGYDLTSGLDQRSVLIANASVTDVDFGYVKDEATGSISGEVFIDETVTNGIADDKETNLSGVIVYLCNAPVASEPCDPTDPEFVAFTTTDARGEYGFSGLPAGQYVVDSDPTTIPSDIDLTVDPAPVALSEGESVTNVDVGYEPAALTGVLSGFVWADNGDGIYQNGEAPLGGVNIIVLLTSPGLLPVQLAIVPTKADGSWILTGISDPDLKNAIIVTYDPLSVLANLVSAQPTNLPLNADTYFPVDLLADDDNNISYLDFAFAPLLSLGSVSGTIYSDANQNSAYNSAIDGELQGVTVNLLDNGGNIIATTFTDAAGNYSFTQLQDGNYTVEISDLANILQDLNPLETIDPITVFLASNEVDQNAGFITDPDLAAIGNRFWFDTNRDGYMQDNESGVSGITVQCWLDGDKSEVPNDPATPTNAPVPGIDNLIRTVVTDTNGEYYCTSLPEGQYIVVVSDALGFTEAGDGTLVTNDAADHAAKPWTYALTDAAGLTADFGVSGVNSVSGSVFIEDQDLVESFDAVLDTGGGVGGVEDGGETDGVGDGVNDIPAGGVTMVLLLQQLDGSFVQVQTTTTDATTGEYTFEGLPDGVYKVEVLTSGSVIDGFGQTADPDLAANAFPNNVCDSNTAAACDDENILTLNGTPVTGNDFGYQKGFVTTPVTVDSFKATSTGSGIEFTWESSNEVGHVGYQIFARTADGWKLLNEQLIVSNDSGNALATKRYNFTSAAVDAKWFTVVDVSAAEVLTPHGPFQIDKSYGEELKRPVEFDWSKVNLSRQPAKSVSSRVERLRQLDLEDGDEPDFEEDEIEGEQ